jgi:hypothetical protein
MRTIFGTVVRGVLISGALQLAAPNWIQGQVFTIDSSQSSVTISGTVAGGTIAEQAPGSLTGKVRGTIRATLNGANLQFPGQSVIASQTNGSWQPLHDGSAGSAPADFGGKANLIIASGLAALRNIQLDVFAPPIPVNGGKFDSSSLTFGFPTNASSSLDYNVSGLVSKTGSVPLTGYATNKVTALASLSTSGNQQTMTIPVDATFFFTLTSANDTVIRLQGQLVATQAVESAFQIQNLTVTGPEVLLQWQASAGEQVQVESSTNLQTWVTNATITATASGLYTWTGAVSGPLDLFRLAR